MSSGGTITPPQTNAAQIPAFGISVSSPTQQQQQQIQNTLTHLFPNGAPFNFPCFNAIAAAAAANGAAAVAASSATGTDGFSQTLRHSHYDNFASQHNNHYNRIKIKRCRQRVDAGEPRNSYQSQLKNNAGPRKEPISLNDFSQFSLSFDSQQASNNCNNDNNSSLRPYHDHTPSENDYAEEIEGAENDESSILNCSLSTSKSTDSSVSSSSARRKSCHPKRQHADDHLSNSFDNSTIHNNNNNEDCDEACRKSAEYKETEQTSDDDDQKTDYSGNGGSSLKIIINRRHNTVSSVDDNAEADGVTDDDDRMLGCGCIASENGSEKGEELCRGHSQTRSIRGNDVDGSINMEKPKLNPEMDDFADEATFSAQFDTSPATLCVSKEYELKNVSARSSPVEMTANSATNLLSSLFLANNNNNGDAQKTENNNSDIQSILEAQRKLSSIFMEQHLKNLNSATSEESLAVKESIHRPSSSSLMFQQNWSPKNEFKTLNPFGGIFGQKKPIGAEQLTHLLRFLEAMTMAQRQQQMTEMFQQNQRCQPLQPHVHSQNLLNGATPNLLAIQPALAAIAAAAAAANNRNIAQASSSLSNPAYRINENGTNNINSGIFPPASAIPPTFHNLIGSSLFSPSTSFRDDSGPRRKRAKVTDSVRGPRSSVRTDCTSSNSQPVSERSSPQANIGVYFPPTMVAHPSLYGRASGSRNNSPINAPDEFVSADYFGASSNVGPVGAPVNALDGIHQQMYTLTHVHLRKAKLMFFYTRYPSSAVLKTYFPDIHFNKNNTAQLVKWFSNFREFYYMQMEKYAKQAIAEGVRHRDDIIVTPDSEIYKQLNQHYNRNNIIQPPVRLLHVIQETLKEFFVALQAGKDSEPSWKKVIYKIIQQLDDPIPEYFKDPNFIETLEQS